MIIQAACFWKPHASHTFQLNSCLAAFTLKCKPRACIHVYVYCSCSLRTYQNDLSLSLHRYSPSNFQLPGRHPHWQWKFVFWVNYLPLKYNYFNSHLQDLPTKWQLISNTVRCCGVHLIRWHQQACMYCFTFDFNVQQWTIYLITHWSSYCYIAPTYFDLCL